MNQNLLDILWDWGIRCFGRDHMQDKRIRSIRVLEEAAELCQSFNVSQDIAAKVIQTVYSRPVGEPVREIGGVLVTIYSLCQSVHVDPEDIFVQELRRVLAKPPEHFTKRNQEKLDLGLS